MIHVFIGTKAQYVKTAPVIRLMEARGIPYRLIDSGQHASLTEGLRRELGIRQPDVLLRRGADIASIPVLLGWFLGLLLQALFRPGRLRERVFGGQGGVCVIHGDTPTTLLSLLLARRAGLRVAHLEAGLRSGRLLSPFPEEIIRLLVMRWADLLAAPSAEAVRNLATLRVRGEILDAGANTVVEAAAWSMAALSAGPAPPPGYALASLHRVETLHRPGRLRQVVEVLRAAAARAPVVFVLHPPTRLILERRGLLARLERVPGLTLRPLLPHAEFLGLLAGAAFVLTDGGSVQEECACLGVPCLILREATERADGLGANAVLSRFDPATIGRFLADPGAHRRPRQPIDARPSEAIVAWLRRHSC